LLFDDKDYLESTALVAGSTKHAFVTGSNKVSKDWFESSGEEARPFKKDRTISAASHQSDHVYVCMEN